MNIRILTIATATAIAVTAFGFNAPASAAPLGLASQTMAQSAAQSLDSPVLEIKGHKGKWGGKKGKWGGHKGKWGGHKGKWGGKKWHGHNKFHFGFQVPTYYNPCYKEVVIGHSIALIDICN